VSLNTMVTADFLHAGVLIVFAVVMWRLAIWRLDSRLIDRHHRGHARGENRRHRQRPSARRRRLVHPQPR
jgi:hypothetical protein